MWIDFNNYRILLYNVFTPKRHALHFKDAWQ